ncbi:MAG: hypothetical protein J1D99_06935 [Campylobacter sp.]|nr:hypothetical protein [Campylobacter sp.]
MIVKTEITYPAKFSFVFVNEIKIFHNKEKLKEYTSSRPALQMILNDVLLTKKRKM